MMILSALLSKISLPVLAGVAIGFAAGYFTAPTATDTASASTQPQVTLRSLDCSKLIVVQKSPGEVITVTGANKLFLKIPDPLGGKGVDEECVKQQVEKYLNEHRGEFFSTNGRQLYVTEAKVIEQGSVRYPDPEYAFVDVRFVVDES